jgi:hypothetical protein
MTTTTAISFDILDVAFRMVGMPDDLAYADTFVGAYADTVTPQGLPVAVSVERAPALPVEATPRSCWVHRSKHRYWDIRGTACAPGTVCWHNRPVSTRCIGGRHVVVTTSPSVSPAVTGEAAWHVCRNLALYHREPRKAKLLHASAVAFGDCGILFIGEVSAGKTTLMTQAVLTHGATPVANDRVLVTLDTPVAVTSWPSYASFTEGTLLDYEPLGRAARDYERGRFPYRTQTWGDTISRQYTKDAKRIFPMHWFTVASSHTYRRHARLGALVLSRLSPNVGTPHIARLDLSDGRTREELISLVQRESFDTHEPSFYPWHGLPLPQGAAQAAALVTAIASQDIPVYRFVAPAPGFKAAFDDLLGTLL